MWGSPNTRRADKDPSMLGNDLPRVHHLRSKIKSLSAGNFPTVKALWTWRFPDCIAFNMNHKYNRRAFPTCGFVCITTILRWYLTFCRRVAGHHCRRRGVRPRCNGPRLHLRRLPILLLLFWFIIGYYSDDSDIRVLLPQIFCTYVV